MKTVPEIHNYFEKSIVVILLATMLFACKRDLKTVAAYGEIDTLPELTARNIEYVRSDSGEIQAILTSPLMYQYTGDDEYIVFPEGFQVEFFDSVGQIQSRLTAEYGISYQKKKIMEARKNVRIINFEKNEQLDTEKLIWDQRKKIIYSDTTVKITTEEDVLFGTGLEADESFDKYEIFDPSGEMEIEEEDEK
ncbi:MAG: LPS export ABC transporter periplasmic protein LptC [Bacteroidales bacterium]|nr:LPS export ABC transporter periplasmic protein LptC [Bacteroidales bacterium]MCF8386666.1 LPS export ABC transporter periplasmic protein LptC [Bacteroidales bacterium]MCF8399286.1 LPS export ABC transporter periplasmic protein LptC [Bacteroidales bacterium]